MSHLYLLGVATLTLTSAGFAGSDTNADLQARLEAAEARISELSAASNANWLNDTRADEIRGLVHDVLADADTRASLQGDGATAGYNGGFTVGSADGNWSMTMNGLLQTQWTYLDSDDPNADSAWGFDTTRSWMNFSGTIAGDYGYNVRHNLGAGTGNSVTWAYGTMNVGTGWDLAMGNMVRADSRESLIGDQNQMALDRDNARAAGNNGAALHYTSDDVRAWVQMFNNGANGAANANASEFNTRVEYKVDGNWGQFDQFHSADGGAAGTLVGFSYRTFDSGDGAATNDGDSQWTLDIQWQFGGSAFYAQYWDSSDDDNSANDDNELQLMYSMDLGDDWEVYARYTDQDSATGDVTSLGLNNYMAGQNAKWTTEITWNDTGAFDTTTVTTQLQFYF